MMFTCLTSRFCSQVTIALFVGTKRRDIKSILFSRPTVDTNCMLYAACDASLCGYKLDLIIHNRTELMKITLAVGFITRIAISNWFFIWNRHVCYRNVLHADDGLQPMTIKIHHLEPFFR